MAITSEKRESEVENFLVKKGSQRGIKAVITNTCSIFSVFCQNQRDDNTDGIVEAHKSEKVSWIVPRGAVSKANKKVFTFSTMGCGENHHIANLLNLALLSFQAAADLC